MVFDTACSSSLVAIHVARRSLGFKECSGAIAIGPNAILTSGAHLGPALTGMTSVLGRCHTFDARADGYLRGEGCCGASLVAHGPKENTFEAVSDFPATLFAGSSARHNG